MIINHLKLFMKKFLGYLLFSAFALVLILVYCNRVFNADQGMVVPDIEEGINKTTEFNKSNLKGNYNLVNFWDSSNAVSRIATGEYDRLYQKNKNKPFRLLSVNTDIDPALFDQIVKTDGLDESTQYHIRNVKGKNLRSDCRIETGFSSYLIDPEGKIAAINPSVQTLERILSQG